jgi:hypothetical protein
MADAPTVLEWYRVDNSRRIRRVLFGGTGVLTVGGLVVAVSFITRQSHDVRLAAAAIGFTCVFGGALFTMIAMHRTLRDEDSVTLRTDGVAVRAGGDETVVAWSDLERAKFDAGRAVVVLERKGGDPVVIARKHAGIGLPALAVRIEDTRRKASFGMLRA